MIKAIAFDFDGTLADSFDVFVHVVEHTLGHKPFTPTEIENLRAHSMRGVIKILKIKKWKLPWLVVKGMREIDRTSDNVALFDRVPEMLKELHSSGYKLYIVSSHSEGGIRKLLDKYDLTQHFEHIYGKVGLWGKPKALKKLQQQHSFIANEYVFVGDEVRDIEAAEKAGIRCIAATWGFNTASSLKAHNPSKLVAMPEELVQAIESLP